MMLTITHNSWVLRSKPTETNLRVHGNYAVIGVAKHHVYEKHERGHHAQYIYIYIYTYIYIYEQKSCTMFKSPSGGIRTPHPIVIKQKADTEIYNEMGDKLNN